MHEKLRYQKFSETKKGSPTKLFGSVRPNNSEENRDTPPSIVLIIFQTQKFSETPKGSSAKFFGTVRQKNSEKKL